MSVGPGTYSVASQGTAAPGSASTSAAVHGPRTAPSAAISRAEGVPLLLKSLGEGPELLVPGEKAMRDLEGDRAARAVVRDMDSAHRALPEEWSGRPAAEALR
ncbi:hypothetical protein [Streptomyces sp. MZ04]|uniref:hypothetical protein n=1 Tax=Streptomyces sp. MZ04 TaxID=2559236 RepID=UPI001FD7F15D|nr:hypothetical protein [Streptomyces sp. MZ04]